jgi:hypothetical protein
VREQETTYNLATHTLTIQHNTIAPPTTTHKTTTTTSYIVTSREVKRLEATTRSPVYAALSSTLKGLPTIRAYGAQARFHANFLADMSLNGSWWCVVFAGCLLVLFLLLPGRGEGARLLCKRTTRFPVQNNTASHARNALQKQIGTRSWARRAGSASAST